MIIRPYQPQDRLTVRKIFQDTAFHGDSYQRFLDDGEWLADFMTDCYLEWEPASCFVAESDGVVVGYLTGSLDSVKHYYLWTRKTLPVILWKFFTRKLWTSKKTWTFLWNGTRSMIRGEESNPPRLYQEYPAHFHINVDKSARGHGTGDQLAQAFLNLVKTSTVSGVHVRTARTDGKHPFFESLGFKILSANQLTVWDYLGTPPYHLITYGLKIK